MLRTAIIACSLTPTLALAQTISYYPELKFTEVLVDPVGPNPGSQIVEVTSIVNQDVDVTGWQLAVGSTLVPFPSLVIPRDRQILLFIASGTTSTVGIGMPTAPTLNPIVHSLTIFRSASAAATDLVDYVSWGGDQTNMALAIAAGRWTTMFDSLPTVAREGQTFAHRMQHVNAPIGPAAWFVDTTWTLGAPSDAGMTYAYALGCDASTPQFGIWMTESDDPGPWLGETYEMLIGLDVPGAIPMFLAFGWNAIPPISLDVIGIPGCSLHTTFDVVVPIGVQSVDRRTNYSYRMSTDSVFTGLTYYHQVIATGLTGQNPAQTLVSWVTQAHVGSR